MRKRMKKGFAWVLMLCMILSLIPASALQVGSSGLSIEGGVVDTDYSWQEGSKTLTILTNTSLTLSGTETGLQVLVNGTTQANLTLNGLHITNTEEGDVAPLMLEDTATLNLTLTAGSENSFDTHYMNGDFYGARADALHVPQDTALTIEGSGILNAYSGRWHAAIGNGEGATGNITINSGTVNAFAYGTENRPGGIGIGGGACGGSITINEGTVTAYGDAVGIGYYDSTSDLDSKESYTISVSGGVVNAYGIPYSDGVDPERASSVYLSSVGIGGHAQGVPTGRNILISGGSVRAYGSDVGIGGDFDESNSGDSDECLSIQITGGQVTAKALKRYGIGVGGKMQSSDNRMIEISGHAEVEALGDDYREGNKSSIGGGDNSQSRITIKGNGVVKAASAIGSTGGEGDTGYAGGIIEILENASVYDNQSYSLSCNHIGGSSLDFGAGGSGGNITINTTGTVSAESIGGGNGDNGGDGGNITIYKGNLSVKHIGGGDGVSLDYVDENHYTLTGQGGNGGTITITGGSIGGNGYNAPSGTTNSGISYGSDRFYYAAAGIGGGGGTLRGGNGGTITISGGEVIAKAGMTVYDSVTTDLVTEGGSGVGIGGAGIGGGNGANGGIINITGGHVVVGEVSMSPYRPSSATAVSALIGGGSAGGAGEIIISGGHVKASVFIQNVPFFGSDATTIGQGKGSADASGFVKITGGTVDTAYGTDNAKPSPWPIAADGSTALYPADLYFYNATNLPAGLSFYESSSIVSMTITQKSNGQVYVYGINEMNPSSYLWLPIKEDTATWEDDNNYHELYDVVLSVKKSNTIYRFNGIIRYRLGENFPGGIEGSSALNYLGEATETLQLTSDWGLGAKTYNGTDQMPSFVVKNSNDDILNENIDYTLEIKYTPNDGECTPVTTTEAINAGGYRATITGKDGTAYEGMTATSDEMWLNAKTVSGNYSGDSFTKQYDGTTDLYNGETKVESLPLAVDSNDLCAGDVLSDIVAHVPRYASVGVGTDIEIDCNSPDFTYTQNGIVNNIFNYNVELSGLTGDITVKVIGETNLDASGVSVSKVYDGTTNCTLTNVTGSVTLVDLVGAELATCTITGVSAYDSKDVGNAHPMTLTIGNLTGANAENYTLAGGATGVEIVNGSILPADYAYNLTEVQQEQEFTSGSGIAQVSLPTAAVGVNSESVTGTISLWHDADCTANPADDSSVNALTVGEHTLYVKFVPEASQTNYTNKVITGKVVVLTVVEGDPQEIQFNTSDLVTKVYGDAPFSNIATNSSDQGADIHYLSSNIAVAEVNADTGEVTIKGAGNATIFATAAQVDGKYRETTVSYTLTINKKPIAISAQNAERKFGTENITFNLSSTSGLLEGDTEEDLAVSLMTSAIATSNVGVYPITGTSTSTNYDVTVTPGLLNIIKADAPLVEDIHKNLLCSEAHVDVAVDIAELPINRGETSFSTGLVIGNTEIMSGVVTTTTTGIQLSTNSGSENQTITIPVVISMQNYEDAVAHVTVTLVNKTPVTITGVTVDSKRYNGSAVTYTGIPTNEQGYSGEYEYVWSSDTSPKNAGSYSLTVKIPESNMDYMGELAIEFTIEKKTLTVKPANISIYTGNLLPSSYTLEYVGCVQGDTIILTGSPVYVLKNNASILENSNTNGSYTIEWTNKDAVIVDHANYSITKADGTLTISSKPSSGGGGGGGDVPVMPNVPVTSKGGVSTATLEADVNISGHTATASMNSNAIKNAIEAAQKAAGDNKTASAVEIQAKAPVGATGIGFSIPKEALTNFVNSKVDTLSMLSEIGELNLSAQTVASIVQQTGGSEVIMSIGKIDTKQALNPQQQAAVAGAPVYDISITSNGNRISAFDGGSITVSLPYTLKENEDPSGVLVWYLDAQGNIQKVQSVYDSKTQTVSFITDHLSLYFISNDDTTLWVNPFADVSEDVWYYDAVKFVQQQGIMGGISHTAFSPDLISTRGMLVTILYRLEGAPITKGNNFTDVDIHKWYASGVAWATENGIAAGYGNGTFGPEKSITREQLSVILMNYAKFKGNNLDVTNDYLSGFNDAATVSLWASSAMNWSVSNGLITGKTNDHLDPKGNATRCQVATILMRFYELTDNK